MKSVQSIRNYLSGIKTMHILLGYSVEHINNFIINLGLKGMARLKPYCIKQAEPITPIILKQIHDVLDLTDTHDTVYWCLFLFAFYLFARKSNLVPTVKKDIEKKLFLCRKDVKVMQNYLIVSMGWSKTIQFGERVLQTPVVEVPGSVLCPVTAYKNMCSKVKVSREEPLFMLSDKRCVFYRDLQKKLKDVIQKIGLDPNRFSSHGFRRGAANFAFRSNVPADLIQLQGDWKSDAYKKYLSLSIQDKMTVARKMKHEILKL